MALIKNKRIVADDWRSLEDDATLTDHHIVSLEYWLENKRSLLAVNFSLGLALEGDADIENFADDVDKFSLICINIPTFADGRGYSLARLLRQTYNYKEELRAVGDILPDQALYLMRVGFDALQLPSHDLAEAALKKTTAFSVFYQPA